MTTPPRTTMTASCAAITHRVHDRPTRPRPDRALGRASSLWRNDRKAAGVEEFGSDSPATHAAWNSRNHSTERYSIPTAIETTTGVPARYARRFGAFPISWIRATTMVRAGMGHAATCGAAMLRP